jgi:hypothetical protein
MGVNVRGNASYNTFKSNIMNVSGAPYGYGFYVEDIQGNFTYNLFYANSLTVFTFNDDNDLSPPKSYGVYFRDYGVATSNNFTNTTACNILANGNVTNASGFFCVDTGYVDGSEVVGSGNSFSGVIQKCGNWPTAADYTACTGSYSQY